MNIYVHIYSIYFVYSKLRHSKKCAITGDPAYLRKDRWTRERAADKAVTVFEQD